MSDTDQQAKREGPCSICGESRYLWGNYLDTAFMPAGQRTAEDWHEQKARYCLSCGNLQVFTELSKKQRQKLLGETA